MIQNELATSNSTTLRNGECDFESYLHNIILAHRTHHPGLVRIPREVRDLRGVTTMDKLQNKRTIVTICYHLLLHVQSGTTFLTVVHTSKCLQFRN